MRRARQLGSILFISIVMMVIIMMTVGVVLKRGESGLFQSSHYRDGIRAVEAARGGVNHVMALLEDNPSYSSDLNITLGNAQYLVTFDPSQPNFSVNNFASDTPSTQLNALGQPVPPFSADLVVTGRAGRVERKVHVLLSRGFSAFGSAAAVGKITLTGDVKIDGIKSLVPPPGQSSPDPAPGGLISKYQSTSTSDPAIRWVDTGSSSFDLSDLSRIEAAPADGGTSISSNLRALYPDQTTEDGASQIVPDIDVNAYVTAGLASPALAGGSTLGGYVYVDDARSRSGNLTVNGTLSLTDGTLYVDGDLTVNGSVEGTGSIFVSGDINVVGGNAVVMTDREAGVALLAGGDVSLTGVDAAGALQSLASTYGFTPASDRLFTLLNDYRTFTTFNWWTMMNLGKHDGSIYWDPPTAPDPPDMLRPLGPEPLEEWISPIPGPSGGHAYAQSNAATTRLILSIQDTHPAYTSDPQAMKVIKALEELQFFFRSNKHIVKHNGTRFTNLAGDRFFTQESDYQLTEGGTPIPTYYFSPNAPSLPTPLDAITTNSPGDNWDDRGQPPELRTHDAIQDDLGESTVSPYHYRRRDAFFAANNPLDADWLGDSFFQGLVYARGNVSAQTDFRVIGALVSLGDIDLANGSTLTYNEDYREMIGQTFPVGLVHYEEF